MKKFLLLLLFLLIGCGTISQSRISYDACVQDEVCMALMKKNKAIVSTAVDSAVDTAGFAGTLAGMFASLITGIFAGSKLKKKV